MRKRSERLSEKIAFCSGDELTILYLYSFYGLVSDSRIVGFLVLNFVFFWKILL